MGVKEEVAPKPPVVAGAAQALDPELANPPNRGLEGVFSFGVSFLSGVSAGVAVKEPKILVALSATVLTALAAACWTASRGVAASTCEGVAGDVVSSEAAAVFRALVSSTTGASLLTPDMMRRISLAFE